MKNDQFKRRIGEHSSDSNNDSDILDGKLILNDYIEQVEYKFGNDDENRNHDDAKLYTLKNSHHIDMEDRYFDQQNNYKVYKNGEEEGSGSNKKGYYGHLSRDAQGGYNGKKNKKGGKNGGDGYNDGYYKNYNEDKKYNGGNGGYDKGYKNYDKGGYDKGGYDNQYYDNDGYDKGGYDKGGYDKGGYNKGGYNKGGYNKGGYDKGGYDKGGYDKGGYDKGGYNKGGYIKKKFTHKKENYNNKQIYTEKMTTTSLEKNPNTNTIEVTSQDIKEDKLKRQNSNSSHSLSLGLSDHQSSGLLSKTVPEQGINIEKKAVALQKESININLPGAATEKGPIQLNKNKFYNNDNNNYFDKKKPKHDFDKERFNKFGNNPGPVFNKFENNSQYNQFPNQMFSINTDGISQMSQQQPLYNNNNYQEYNHHQNFVNMNIQQNQQQYQMQPNNLQYHNLNGMPQHVQYMQNQSNLGQNIQQEQNPTYNYYNSCPRFQNQNVLPSQHLQSNLNPDVHNAAPTHSFQPFTTPSSQLSTTQPGPPQIHPLSSNASSYIPQQTPIEVDVNKISGLVSGLNLKAKDFVPKTKKKPE